jgi:hypothetical protein
MSFHSCYWYIYIYIYIYTYLKHYLFALALTYSMPLRKKFLPHSSHVLVVLSHMVYISWMEFAFRQDTKIILQFEWLFVLECIGFFMRLEVVYHNQNYWGFGLFPSSSILGTRKHDVSETGSVSVLRCLLPFIPEDGNIQFPKRRVF